MMDDESAEIELVRFDNCEPAILSSFDTRLVKLEKSVLPLYNSTQILNRRASNIEKALAKIDDMASNQDGIAAEEALILRGPQAGQLQMYQDTLERLNAAIAFKSSERDSSETAQLVETGAKKLAQLYTKLVAEGSSGSPPVGGLDFIAPLFPPDLLAALRPLVIFLRTLPTPTTHPSHPAASAIQSALKDAQRGYADMRGSWNRKALETYGKRVVDRAETIDGIVAGREFGKWVDNLLTVAEDEWELLLDLAPLPGQSLGSTYNTLLTPLLTSLSNTIAALISLIKKSLQRYTFLALSSFEALSALQPRWDQLQDRRGTDVRNNELKDGLNSLRGVCLRSFPELIADVKMASMGSMGKLGDTTSGIADFVVTVLLAALSMVARALTMLQTVQYMERVPEVLEAVGSALLSLGDGNWRMGDGMPTAAKSTLGPGEEPIIVEHFMFDVVNTLLTSLTTLATSKRPAFGSIFLINNVAYLRTHLALAPRTPTLPGLLARPTLDLLNASFRSAKAGYFSTNYGPLMQVLADDPGAKGGMNKAATKERFTRFFDLLEEITERHRMARVLEDDDEGKDTVGEEVVKLVVPSLQKFTQKNREKEFSKNPQKYIKMSADEVETRLRSFYR
ncbi:hypothetical protein HWV62_37859 [Athelia sp. TMB]|nr:hypothetical protein HWV62_37859 [Athelia sp. TMB]